MSKRTPSEIEAKVVAALEIGRSMPDTARQFCMDLSTVKRIRKRYGVTLGAARSDLVEEARREAKEALEPGWVKEQAAFLIRDDVAHVHQLRDHINELLEAMPEPKDMMEFGLVARSLTAISTALKNSSDMSHKSLGLDRSEIEPEGMPMLVVSELSPSEVAEMRRKQEEDQPLTGAEEPVMERKAA